jgi:hypothetical protein
LVTLPKYEFKMCSRVAASVAYATGTWAQDDAATMLRELSGLEGDRADAAEILERATQTARQKAKAFTGTGDIDWWVRAPAAHHLREGRLSRAERLQDPLQLGHLMVCSSYREYEDRAVRFGMSTRWAWKDISAVPADLADLQAHAENGLPFFPSREQPMHILTPTGPLIRLRRRLFLTRDHIPLFDTARWVRDIEKGLLLCWETWLRGWAKVKERNARELVVLKDAGLELSGVVDQHSWATERERTISEPQLRSRCLWVEDEDIQKGKL